MTTFVDFVQPVNQPFQFSATLDGSNYTVTVPWNLSGQRLYINIFALDGTRILTIPRIGSPLGTDINLVEGYFTSTLIFRAPTNQFEITP